MLGQSHGFNSVHGRMPSVLTGASLANRDLIYLGVSGDGDTASIGLGQFAHAMRRGVDMVYIVENNGVYGLTKGQFSATSDKGSKSKKGVDNPDAPIDLVAMALQLGATFVARCFSGDKSAVGAADQGGVRASRRRVHRRDLALRHVQQSRRLDQELRLRARAQCRAEFARLHHGKGADRDRLPRRARRKRSHLHDGSSIRLHKLADEHDWRDRSAALAMLERHRVAGEIVTGLIYLNDQAVDLHQRLGTTKRPLNALAEADLCPGSKALAAINASLR